MPEEPEKTYKKVKGQLTATTVLKDVLVRVLSCVKYSPKALAY